LERFTSVRKNGLTDCFVTVYVAGVIGFGGADVGCLDRIARVIP